MTGAARSMRLASARKDGHAAMRLISGIFGAVCVLWILIAAGSVIDPAFIPKTEGLVQSLIGGTGNTNR